MVPVVEDLSKSGEAVRQVRIKTASKDDVRQAAHHLVFLLSEEEKRRVECDSGGGQNRLRIRVIVKVREELLAHVTLTLYHT